MNAKALLRTSLILILFVFAVSKKSHSLPVETEYPGTLVHEGYIDDEEWGPFPIGFSFSFFCNNYTQFYVTSNGLVMFGSGSTDYTNDDIPDNDSPNNYIAAFWDDLIVHSTGAIHYKTVGTAPNRKLIVQYTNMAFWNSPVLLGTFQIILYEGSNKIQTQYRSIIDLTNPRASGNSATLGLEKSSGNSGIKNSYNQAGMVRSEKAIAYTTDGCSYTFDNNAIYDGVLLTEPTPRAGITKLLSPANNSIASYEVNFKWEAAPNATSYNVIISTNADLSSPIHNSANLTDLNYLYTLTPDQTYYWSVNAKNSNNLVTWTEIWKFTTSANPPLVAVPQELFLEQNDQRTSSLLFTGGDATTKTATITSLPAQGALFQFDNTPITTVPTNITDDSFRFIYKATGNTGNGVGNFNFRFSDASGTSDQATYTVNVSPAGIPNFLYASKQADRVEITFDRAMADPTGKHLQFAIRDNGALVTPLSAALKSGDPATIIIYSSSPLNVNNTIEVAYTKGTITALSGGVLESFSFQLAGKKAQVINFDELAVKTYGDPAFIISATASSGLPVTFTSSNSTVAGVSGNTVTINNSGSCLITASQAGDNEFHSVSFQRLLTVNKATATITISNTTQAYTGSGIAVATTTNPVGLPVKVEYDNADALPFDVGAYNVEVEVIHANYQGTASATLTIIDDANPVPDLASLPDITAECSATVSTIPTATDNYSGTINGTTANPLTYNTQGTFVITWSYNDGNGNIVTQEQNVIIDDNSNPSITAPSNKSVNVDLGSCSATSVALGTPVTTDNCTVASVTNNAPASFPIGITTVKWTVTDGAGNIATANQTVTVVDNIIPTITAPANKTVNVGAGSCSATSVALGTPVTTDNCTVASVTNNAPASFPIGNTTVKWTVTDGAGNTATANQTVTVVDNIIPTITAPANVTVNVGAGSCSATGVALGTPVTSDNCTVATVTNNAPASFPIGITTVKWTVTDGAGNTATANQTVTVVDNIIPTITAPANKTVNVGAGSCSATGVALGTPVTSDNCTVATVTNNAPASFPIGNTTVKWTVTDGAGNTATANQTVTVVDNIIPTITAPANKTVNVGAGSCSATSVALGTPVTSDNCTVASVTNNAPASYPIGITTVKWTVTDGAGNTATANQTVTVVDNIIPTITAPANKTVNVDLGSCSATGIALGTPVTSDNCTVASVTNNAPASFPIGTTTVKWTVTDGAGNIATANQTVTVVDNIIPTITAPANKTVNVGAGSCSATGVALGTPVTSDNCTVATVTNNAPASFPIGTTTVKWTVTDAAGNTATANQTVTVVDNIIPTITAPANVTVNVGAGSCSATGVALGTPVTSDNCTVASVTNNAPASFPIGNTTVKWTVTDGAGNTATANQTVTVVDNIIPTITAPANKTVNVDLGSCSASSVALGTPVTSDNCTVASVTNNAPASFPIGVTTVKWTVTDGAGNIATANQIVTVVDNIIPTITAPANVTVNVGAGSCSATGVTLGTPVTTDNCTVASVTNNAPASFPIGTTSVKWTVTDGAGNTATANQTVTVVDNIIPTITAPANVTVNVGAGSCSATGVALGTPVTSDNCTIASVTNNAPASFPIGTTTVKWTVTDGAENTATANQIVTVVDNIIPTITAPANKTVNVDLGSCSATNVALGTPVTTDNCTIASVTNNAPASFPIGTTTVKWTVTDAAGNTATANQTVTVVDNQIPTITAPANKTVNVDLGSCSATSVALGTPVTSDNCTVASVTNNAPASFPIGTTTVIWTVTDAAGNTATANQTVTVVDNIIPTITAPANKTVNVDLGSCSATNVTLGTPVTLDNCTIASVTNDAPASFPIGTTTVIWTVTDGAGNTATANQTITVVDNQAPLAIAKNITIELDALGNVGITPADIDNGSFDNCNLMLSIDNASFNCSNVGANTVILTATDDAGNSSTANAIVTVVDNLSPIVITKDISIELDENGTAIISASDIDNGSYDNCGISSMSLDITEFNCSNVGENTVEITITDNYGYSASATAIVTVSDLMLPIALTQDIIVELDESGNATITASQIDNGSFDNCSITSYAIDINSFDCSHVGTDVPVVMTITDANGNSANANAIVTVVDNLQPVLVNPGNQIVSSAENCMGEVIDFTSLSSATDNCSTSLTITQSPAPGTSFIGSIQVTLSSSDESGNTGSISFMVFAEDDENPLAIAQDITAYLNQDGTANITAADIDNGSTDNCSIDLISIDVSEFNCSHIGNPQTVTLTIVDGNGNSDQATALVTVVDTIAPAAITQDITVILDPENQATITAMQVDGGSSDNCAIESMSIDISTFDCSNLGLNTVTLTVTDFSGNATTATAQVIVLDTVAPVAITQNINVYLDENGNATISPADINNESFDNCAIDEMTIDINTFNCSNIGQNQVTLNVTDFSGNTASAIAIVTVSDNTAPVAISKDINVYLDETGFAQITAEEINDGSFDNCSIADISIDINAFDCENIGENQVLLTITDLSGNTATDTASVTILDNILPQIICVADTTIDVPEQIGTYTVTDTSFDALASDNCSFTISNNFNESPSLQAAIFAEGTTEIEWTVTDQAGNVSTCSMSITVNIITSANVVLLNSIKVYPNPVKDILNIQVPHNNEFKVSMKDLSGREMFRGTMTQTNHSIDVSEYAKGVYMLEISNAFGSKVFRIIVD